jgi:hypothetical protein
MNTLLQSVFQESLEDLKSLNEQRDILVAGLGPVEAFEAVDPNADKDEIITAINQHEADDEELREQMQAYLEAHEGEHQRLEKEMTLMRDTISAATTSMESLRLLTSMEDVDNTTTTLANETVRQVARLVDEDAPELVAEDGKFTTVSLESLGDFIKKILTKIRNFIKEKYDNMVMFFRRGSVYKASLQKRIQSARERLNSMPAEYGIPAGMVRYPPKGIAGLGFDKGIVSFEEAPLKAAVKQVIEQFNPSYKLVEDAIKRSTVIADNLASIMVMRNEVDMEQKLKAMYKEVSTPWLTPSLIKFEKEVGGVTYFDGSKGYHSRYRDVAWIMELVDVMSPNYLKFSLRQGINYSSQALELETLHRLLDECSDLFESAPVQDDSYWNELYGAWREASMTWDRLVTMVNSLSFPHISQELWRAIDISATAMFRFLDAAYYETVNMQMPAYRLMDALLFVVEENGKAYAKINR